MKTLTVWPCVCLLLTGCASRPAAWANELGGKLRCGMTVSEVQQLAQKPIERANRSWMTHLVRDGATDVWLTFENDRLRAYQVAWVKPLTMVEETPRVELCAAK